MKLGNKIKKSLFYLCLSYFRKRVFLAVEVWVDVFGFIKRIQLARVSLTNWRIYQICWPRLHGNKVVPYEVEWLDIKSQEQLDGLAATALLLKDSEEVPVPFAVCPPPAYITGFSGIG